MRWQGVAIDELESDQSVFSGSIVLAREVKLTRTVERMEVLPLSGSPRSAIEFPLDFDFFCLVMRRTEK